MKYELRDPNYTIPIEPDKRIAEPTSVNPFVVLKADRGIGPQLVQEIRDLVGLQTFDQQKIDQFCRDYEVTEQRDKNALRNLLNVLKKSDLELVDPDARVPRPVECTRQMTRQMTGKK